MTLVINLPNGNKFCTRLANVNACTEVYDENGSYVGVTLPRNQLDLGLGPPLLVRQPRAAVLDLLDKAYNEPNVDYVLDVEWHTN